MSGRPVPFGPHDDDDLDFLFPVSDTTAPFVPGSDTSLEAARGIEQSAGVLRAQVHLCVANAGSAGVTDEEIQVALGMNPSTERPRRGELVTQGKVVDSGDRRKTISGRQAVVWVAVPPELQQGQQVETQTRGKILRELQRLVQSWSSSDLAWLLGQAQQQGMRQMLAPTEEPDPCDLLDEFEG